MNLKDAFLIIDHRSPVVAAYRRYCPGKLPGKALLLPCLEIDLSGQYAVARVKLSHQETAQTICVPHSVVLGAIAGEPGKPVPIGFLQGGEE